MMTQLHSKLPLLISILLGLLSVQASGEIITKPPLSHNTTLGSSVTFTCVALPDTLVLGWTINGSSALAHKYGAVNSNHDSLTFTTVLTVIASNELNGSVVSCLAWSNQGNANLSSLLLIQGLLQSVDDLSVTQINSSFINISFVPPHTLHNVPIVSYHLTLRALHTNTTTSIILSNTTLSSLLPLPTQCEEYSISITPVNGAGNGYTATQRIKVIKAPVIETDSVELFIYKSSNESLPQLNISLKITQPNCGSWIHHYVKINTRDHTHSFGPLPLTNGTAELVLSNLTENRFYKLVMWDENVGGVSNTVNTTISSYDVQNVSANSPQEGVLCITCSFMKGSSDIGCYSELTHTAHNTGYTALHIGREKGEESVSGCVTKLEEGLYNIAVYDIETNGRRATPPAVILTDIRIMNNEMMTTSTNTVLPSPTGIIGTTTSPSVSLPTTTSEISDSSFSVRPYRDTAIGIGSLLIIMIIVLILLTVYHVRRRRQRKVWETERHHGTLRRTTSFQSRPTDEYEGQPTSELEREVTPSTISSDEMSPSLAPPPPPPSSLNTSSPLTMTTDLPSPDSQSDTGLMLRDNTSGQPRTKRSLVSTLRATPVLSAWAAVNQLASLPISELTEPPPPPSYESALNISTQPFDRPQSVIIPSRININTAQATPPLSARPQEGNQFNEYAQLEFPLHPTSLQSPLPPAAITNDNEENCWYNPQPVTTVASPPPAVNNVQYSTINSHNLRTNFKRIPLSHSLV